ncbi:MAG: hypothetical protein Q9208_000915 [Pyrenodesmia sp. 3 TL-2023]
MSDYLEQCDANASETLRLAIRAQHLRRWEVPRSSYAMNKTGYHLWRTYLKKRQAEMAAQICLDSGYPSEDAGRVAALVRKDNLKQDAETQTLEDVACLVFLDDQLEAFEKEHDEAKIVNILRKTWGNEVSENPLSISNRERTQGKAGPVPEAWQDELEVSSSGSSASGEATQRDVSSIPNAPPPTPISPSARNGAAWGEFPSTYSSPSGLSHAGGEAQSPSSRPEKSTATAGRMIAGALGVKAPKKSEEAMAYERAVREKESKRLAKQREERKTEEERRQQAYKQVWEE